MVCDEMIDFGMRAHYLTVVLFWSRHNLDHGRLSSISWIINCCPWEES